MKKSASSPPVSVRFLNSSSDPAGSGDEGLEDERPALPAAGDGQKVDASPDTGQPVAPPRRHSARSRADELKDALQDLSPVKELVSRLGKTRSPSVDAGAAPEPRASHDNDAWSRFTELRGKITKTVEHKISDYRGSARPSGGGAPADAELLSEEDVLRAVRDSPPPSPSAGRRPPSPPPAECPDVAFVNVPSPVAAPAEPAERVEPADPAAPTAAAAASPPGRREFRLASIRPKIYERLQRHVGRPTAPPPAPPPAANSVTLSALQGKYIDEEAVEAPEEAVEPLQPAPAPSADQPAAERPAAAGSEPAPPPSEPASAPEGGLLAALPGPLSWRWLAAGLAVLVAAPLPPFLSGLLLGAALTALVGAALLPLLLPPPRRLPPPPTLPAARPPVKEHQPALIHKDWMHELLVGPYEPDTHQPTEARFVRLEGSMLRISHPKGHVPKRAQWDEHIPNLPFVQQRIYDIEGCSVELLPHGLHHSRWWNRRYPLCVRLENCRRVTRSMGLIPSQQRAGGGGGGGGGGGADRPQTSDGESEPAAEESPGLDGAQPADPERSLTLFARTDRGKQHWLRLLTEATRAGERAANPPAGPDPEPAAPRAPGSPGSQGSQGSQGSAAGQEEAAAAGAEPTPKLDFDYYMAKLIVPASEPGPDSRPPSPADGPSAAPPSSGHVMWFNALIGRLAFDVFGSRRWAEFVQSRIQRKLSRIRLPFFIEELAVTSCDLGSVVPRILSVGSPSSDQRGLWIDMAVLYEGGACMTLRTKANLMKLSKPDRDQTTETDASSDKKPPSPSGGSVEKTSSCASYQCDRNDDLASIDSSSDEDEPDTLSGSDGGSPPSSAAQAQPTSKVGKRLLQVVDKVTTSRYFQQAAQNRYVKRYMEEFSNTPLELTVTLKHLQGLVTINIPRPPNDRLWYGFQGQPDILLSAHPRLGTRDVTLTQVTDWIENKLVAEVMKLLVLPNMDDIIVPLLEGQMPESGP